MMSKYLLGVTNRLSTVKRLLKPKLPEAFDTNTEHKI